MYTSERGCGSTVELLILKSININTKKIPQENHNENGHKNIADLLRKHEAK